MKRVAAPTSFAGSQLGEARRVCAFFSSDDEEYRVLLPFITDGFECGSIKVRRAMFGRLASSSKGFSTMSENSKEDLWQRQKSQ